MSAASPADRLRAAAFELFAHQGYDATTVDQIAARAAVGRSTFFRAFGTKDDVVFPDHATVLAGVRERLRTDGPAGPAGTAGTDAGRAVEAATRYVLEHFLEEGELARARYRLTRSFPLLRAREIAHQQQYLQAYREGLRGHTGETPDADLRAELMAASIVTGHNHVLRRWLRGHSTDAEARAELEAALAVVLELHASPAATGPSRSTVLVVETAHDATTTAELVRRALGGSGPPQ